MVKGHVACVGGEVVVDIRTKLPKKWESKGGKKKYIRRGVVRRRKLRRLRKERHCFLYLYFSEDLVKSFETFTNPNL
jgi:hypothetical protein